MALQGESVRQRSRGKCNGYAVIRVPEHPRSSKWGYVYEHILVAETSNGGPLAESAVVHHLNGIKTDNRAENLMLFVNNSEHRIFHRKEKARIACGNSEWRQCVYCKQYDDIANLKVRPGSCYHKECSHTESKRRYAAGLCVKKPKKLALNAPMPL